MYLKECGEMCVYSRHRFMEAGFGATLIFFIQHICISKCSRMIVYYFQNGKRKKSYLKINKQMFV